MKKYFLISIAILVGCSVQAQQKQAKWEKEYDYVDDFNCGLAKAGDFDKTGLTGCN